MIPNYGRKNDEHPLSWPVLFVALGVVAIVAYRILVVAYIYLAPE